MALWKQYGVDNICDVFSWLMPGVLFTIRRNLISVLFPTLCAWAIYADWSRTQRYKANKIKKLEAAQRSAV